MKYISVILSIVFLVSCLINTASAVNTSQPAGTVFFRNMTGLISGEYSLKEYANDTTGVSNVSETRVVTVIPIATASDDFNIPIPAATLQNTPTYDGSGQGMHPDVLYFPNAWNGYKYWMVMTPYPNGNDNYENPSILSSNDGKSWIVPAGLTNPIDPEPHPENNQDGELIYNSDLNRLETFWVQSGAGGVSYLKKRTSTNGIAWSDEQDIFNTPNYWIQSQAITKNDNLYEMWYDGSDACITDNVNVNYRYSTDLNTWSSPQSVNIPHPGVNVWHVNVEYIPTRNEYWMLYAAYPKGSRCTNTDLYFAKSKDKINWGASGKIILPRASWYSANVYRSAFTFDEDTNIMKVWITGWSNTGEWHIGYTQVNILTDPTTSTRRPAITSWNNNKTNDNNLALTLNTSESVMFDATANQTITAWNWVKDGINQNRNFDDFTTFWSLAGTRTIKVNATNSNGTSNTITWTVIVKAPSYQSKPAITSWNNNKTNDNNLALTLNTSESVRFDATANQTITAWNWVKDGINQNRNFDDFTTSWSLAGTRTIKVKATNSNGTSNTIRWTVIVKAPSYQSKPAITSWINNKTIDNNLALTLNTSESVRFEATANQKITAWNWVKDGINQNRNFDDFTTSWSLAGTRTIKVNATNSNGKSNTITWNVTVKGQSPLTITITSPEDKSVNNTGFINVTVTLNRTGTAFLNWEGSNESLGEGNTFYKNKIGLLSGNYSFRVYANDSAGISNVSQIKTIKVNRSITKTLDINQSTGNLSKDEIIISPSGNVTVTIFNGTNATINSTRITNITIDSPRTVPYSLTDGNDRFIGENLTLGPDGALFNPEIRLNFSFNDSQLGTIPASRLKIKFYNNATSRWDELTTTINQTGRIATATTTHFSTFALMGSPEPTPNLPSTSSGGGGGGGSSGGGGGGGSSGENYTNIEVIEKYDLQISKDALTSYRFTHAKNPIMFVNITGNTSLGIFTASIEALKGTSTLVKVSPEGLIYKNVNIWVGTSGFATPKNIKEALIKFRIDNAWMSTNGVLAIDIVLMKWDSKSWINLETKLLSKDDTNTYFEGKTNAFSPFVITQLKKSVPPAMPQATAQSGIPANVTATIHGEKTSEGAQPINFSIIIAMFVIIGIVTLVYIKRREIFKK